MASILSIGTSVPQYSLSQAEIAERLNALLNLEDEEAWVLEKIFKNSAIERRYSVLPDIVNHSFGMTERNAIYKKEAPDLAEIAARRALKDLDYQEITHVLSVSCTGAITPGIESILAQRLGLDPYVSLLGINFMGCHGAFKGLKVASKIAMENPKNRVLLVCTELCSLHLKSRGDIESIVIQSLFADGSAAVVVGMQKGLFEIIQELSYAIPNSMKEMTWDASNQGFDMTLSQKVPLMIGEYIEPFVKRLAGNFENCDWAIHPGGKAIVEAVEKTMSLDRSQTESTWSILRQFGNISSATFLYVLEEMSKKPRNKKVIGLGFGPGLCVEGLLLA